MGPCSHWSRQPDLLMRTRPPRPAALVRCWSSVCRSLVPSEVQEGRGAPWGRVLWQTKTWRSKAGIGESPDGCVVSHPSRNNKNAARVGHPFLLLRFLDSHPSRRKKRKGWVTVDSCTVDLGRSSNIQIGRASCRERV